MEVPGVEMGVYAMMYGTWLILIVGGELETGSAAHARGCCTKIGQY